MSKHTPGPQEKAVQRLADFVHEYPLPWWVDIRESADSGASYWIVCSGTEDDPEVIVEDLTEEQARLIAAAPTMAADLAIISRACRSLLTTEQCATLMAEEEAVFGRAEAIAKAEGGLGQPPVRLVTGQRRKPRGYSRRSS